MYTIKELIETSHEILLGGYIGEMSSKELTLFYEEGDKTAIDELAQLIINEPNRVSFYDSNISRAIFPDRIRLQIEKISLIYAAAPLCAVNGPLKFNKATKVIDLLVRACIKDMLDMACINFTESIYIAADLLMNALAIEFYIYNKRAYDALNPSNIVDIYALRSTKKFSEALKAILENSEESHVSLPSTKLHRHFERAIATQSFKMLEGSAFPASVAKEKDFEALMEMRPTGDSLIPHELRTDYQKVLTEMHQKVQDLGGDMGADVVDIIFSKWLAQRSGASVHISADEILDMRGITQKKNGSGYLSGHRVDDRKRIAAIVSGLDNIWITINDMTIYETIGNKKRRSKYRMKSRAFVIMGMEYQTSMDDKELYHVSWSISPGEVFSGLLKDNSAMQYTLLSTKALKYEPKKQMWEKRIAKYLSYVWRCSQSKGSMLSARKVRAILEGAPIENLDYSRPLRIWDRLESALNKLLEDEIISAWQWHKDDFDENITQKHGWIYDWLEWRLVIRPNEIYLQQFEIFEDINIAQRKALVKEKIDQKLLTGEILIDPARITQARQILGLNQTQLAHIIGISRSYMTRIENNTLQPSPAVLERLNEWLDSIIF